MASKPVRKSGQIIRKIQENAPPKPQGPVKPENFKGNEFLSELDKLWKWLLDVTDEEKEIDDSFPAKQLKNTVVSVTGTIENYSRFSMQASEMMKEITELMTKLRNRIDDVLSKRYEDYRKFIETGRAGRELTTEEIELMVKQKKLGPDLAKLNEALVKATEVALRAEQMATEAKLWAVRAAEGAKEALRQFQEAERWRKEREDEERKRQENEDQEMREKERAENERKRKDEARRNHEKTEEDARKAKQDRLGSEKQEDEDRIAREEAEEGARKAEEERLAREQEEEEVRKAEEERLALERAEEGLRKAEEDRTAQEEVERLKEEREKKEAARQASLQRLYVYEMVSINEFDGGITCIIRGVPENMEKSMLHCEVIDSTVSDFVYEKNEELVSSIIRITSSKEETTLEFPILVAVPISPQQHRTSQQLMAARESIIKIRRDERRWKEVNSYVKIFDDFKHLKFVEFESTSLNLTFAAVTHFKRETIRLQKNGSTTASTIDKNITFTCEDGWLNKMENLTLQVMPIDGEVKQRLLEMKGLLTYSPIISCSWTVNQFNEKISITLPIPANPVKARNVAATRTAKENKHKKMVSFGSETDGGCKSTVTNYGKYGNNPDDDENDRMYFVRRNKSGHWSVENIEIIQLKLDLVQFELPSPIERFIVLRTKVSTTDREAESYAEQTELNLNKRSSISLMKQSFNYPTDVILTIIPQSRLVKHLETEGSDASKEFLLSEGDWLQISFLNNIKCVGEMVTIPLVFNSNLEMQVHFQVTEVDKYLQKSYKNYQGVVQICNVSRQVALQQNMKSEKVKKQSTIVQTDQFEVVRHVISIPKGLNDQPRLLNRAPFVLSKEDERLLHFVASELGDEWIITARELQLNVPRIEAIRLLAPYPDTMVKFEMLLTWFKMQAKLTNKYDVLQSALRRTGRNDLALRLREESVTLGEEVDRENINETNVLQVA